MIRIVVACAYNTGATPSSFFQSSLIGAPHRISVAPTSVDRPSSSSSSSLPGRRSFFTVPVVRDRASVSQRIRVRPPLVAPVLFRSRIAFRGVPPLGIICTARPFVRPSVRLCVCHRLSYFFLAISPPGPRSSYSLSPFSFFSLLSSSSFCPSLRRSLSLSLPLHPSFPSLLDSIVLPSLASSLPFFFSVRRLPHHRRSPPDPLTVPCLSPPWRRLLFSPLCPCILPRRESAAAAAAAASFAGRLRLSRPVNREISSRRSEKRERVEHTDLTCCTRERARRKHLSLRRASDH